MSREHLPYMRLPYMSDEQFHQVAFVFRSKTDGIRVVGLLEAKNYDDKAKYQHLATLDSFRWIECLLNNTPKERTKQIKDVLK